MESLNSKINFGCIKLIMNNKTKRILLIIGGIILFFVFIIFSKIFEIFFSFLFNLFSKLISK